MTKVEILCGNASDSLYLTYKGGCRKPLTYQECYRCTGCGGRFHKDCILEHFKLEESHDWGRQQEREKLEAHTAKAALEARIDEVNGVQLVYNHMMAQTHTSGVWQSISDRRQDLKAELAALKQGSTNAK